MVVTSATAAKILRKLNDERDSLLKKERSVCRFNAAMGEDPESVRPVYDFAETQVALAEVERKIRNLKHKINMFNVITIVGDLGMSIDEVLVYIPQLTEKKRKLNELRAMLPKQREEMRALRGSNIIDYVYANFSPEEAEAMYVQVSDELAHVQTALDLTNSTVTFEI